MAVERSFYERLADGMSDGVYFIDRRRIIRYWNQGAERITGFTKSDVIGTCCRDNVLMHVDGSGKSLCHAECCPALATIMDGRERETEAYLHHKEGFRLPVLARISPVKDDEGNITGAVEVFSDNRRMHEMSHRIEELEKLALIDPLTRIGNRRYAEITLENGFGNLRRYGLPFGILFMDVDHFKRVNDLHGHETGDKVLQMVAGTLMYNLRTSDAASRWGGEEFLAVVPNVGRDEIAVIGRKLLSLIGQSSLDTPAGPLRVTVSIGASLARLEESRETLVCRADHLMYQSKANGRNTMTTDF